MPTDPTSLAAAAAAAAGFAVAVSVVLGLRLRRAERVLAALGGADGDVAVQLAHSVQRAHAATDGLRAEVDQLRAGTARVAADVATALRHVAMVRYDAFDDVGGQLSFSVALLDDAGDGLVLTTISSRSETRSYAKGVAGGYSGHPLSPEEREALDRALGPRPAARRPAARRPAARRPAGVRS